LKKRECAVRRGEKLIKVFSGKWRGLGDDAENGFGMILDFRFRDILYHFKGAKLGVFLCIALHADENGLAYPGYELIQKETGYSMSTINEALDSLCEMEIDGKRVLIRYRERDEQQQFVGSNRYLIFPTNEEIQQQKTVEPDFENRKVDEPDFDFPNLEKSKFGKTEVEVKPDIKLNHSLSNSASSENEKAPERQRITAAQKKGDIVDGMLFYARNRTEIEIQAFPEDVQGILREFIRLWQVDIPRKPRNGKGGEYAQWIGELRALSLATREFGTKLLVEVHKEWQKNSFWVDHPGALIRTTRALAGTMRQKNQIPVEDPEPMNDADKEKLRAAIRSRKEPLEKPAI
jgi:hypothetical protein